MSTYLCRFDGVESRLQETSAEFEATRTLAKKTRSDFEIIKTKVCMYVCIDVILLCMYVQMLFCHVRMMHLNC